MLPKQVKVKIQVYVFVISILSFINDCFYSDQKDWRTWSNATFITYCLLGAFASRVFLKEYHNKNSSYVHLLWTVILKRSKPIEQRPFIEKGNKWMKTGEDYVNSKCLFEEHPFKLRSYCTKVWLLRLSSITLYVLKFKCKTSSKY